MWAEGQTETERGGGSPGGGVPCAMGKEGILLRNVNAAPICDHFTVVTPGCWIREPVPFLT